MSGKGEPLTTDHPGSYGREVQLPPPFPDQEFPDQEFPDQEFATMSTPSASVEIYCVKCKAKTASQDIEAVTMKNGRPATRSVCVECGTKKFRIGVLP